MTVTVVSAGTTSVGISMVSGDQLSVGGLAVDTTDAGAAAQILQGGGVMSRTTLENDALLVVSSTGSAVSGTADGTSEVIVRSGGSLSNFNASGLLELDQGSFGEQLVIGQGGVDLVNTVAVSGQVAAGGTQEIFLHGLDEFGTVAGVQRIFEGEASQDTILSGGFQEVNANGVADEDLIDSGGLVVISRFGEHLQLNGGQSGGTVTLGDEAIADGIAGSMAVLSNGLDIGSTILSGGGETVSSGGKSQEQIIEAAGVLTVLSGGLTSLTTISGQEVVGGLDLSATISSGGLQLVPGGTASSGTVESGGKLQVAAGGVAFSATISSGASLTISAGGLASLDVVQSGASAFVLSGGTASGGLVDAGATETISAGGRDEAEFVAGSLTVRGSAIGDNLSIGELTALSGGVVVSAVIGVDSVDRISSGARASATEVEGDGTEVVLGGGVTTGAQIFGGQELVSSGGKAIEVTVNSVGVMTVFLGGAASGALVSSGGVLRVAGGGVASAASVFHSGAVAVLPGGFGLGTILSGGSEFDNGVTRSTVVKSGGREVVEVQGKASGAVIGVGGLLTVLSGGEVLGGLRLFGGEAVISGTMAAGQTATFAGSSAVLQLDNLAGFAAKISGMKSATQQVDLGGFAFSSGETASWVQSGTSGTLTVTDGAKVAHLTLIGTYNSSSFKLSDDGHSGTFVADPPAATPAASRFVEVAAGFGGGHDPGFAAIHAGGTALFAALPPLTGAVGSRPS